MSFIDVSIFVLFSVAFVFVTLMAVSYKVGEYNGQNINDNVCAYCGTPHSGEWDYCAECAKPIHG